MAITFGVLLQVDRAPAVAVPPPQPVIEATVVSGSSTAINAINQSSSGTFNFANRNPMPQQVFQTYNPRGEQKSEGQFTGTRLNIVV